MSHSTVPITIEQLEALAASLSAEEAKRRESLLRIIRAYVRIIAVRDPSQFRPRATVYGDEDGHWDNSYPPKLTYKQRTGPCSITLRKIDFDSRATSEGFYHDLEFFTEEPSIVIDADGDFQAGTLTGTGRFGQFAAHPGECGVECEIDFSAIADSSVPTDVLEDAEATLREIAFADETSEEAMLTFDETITGPLPTATGVSILDTV